MLPPFLRLPVSTTLCAASLCSAAVLLLQNVPACARWAEEHGLASCSHVQDSVQFLQRVSESVCLPTLNQAELSLADSASSLLELSIGEIDPLSLLQPLPGTPSVPSQDDEVRCMPCVSPPSAPQPLPTAPPEEHALNREVVSAPPEVDSADEDAMSEPEAHSADGDAKPEPEVRLANEDAKQGPISTCEGDGSHGHENFSGIFSPSPFLSVLPKFSLPPLSLSLDASRRSLLFVRTAAPQSPSAKPPEASASEPAVDSGSAPSEGSTVAVDAKPEAPHAAQELTLPEGETTPPMRCRILMVGDSLMEALGPMTHRAMKHRMGLEFIISARYSTGLCRPDYFNWPEHLSDVVHQHKPDLAVFFIGANDGMPVLEGKRNIPLGGEVWRAAYAAKMAVMVNIVRQVGADIIWVELPSAGSKFNKHLSDTRQVQHSFCESHGISIFHTDLIFSGEEGRFEPYGDFHGTLTRLRKKDLVHLTEQGNQKLIEHLLPLLEQHLYAFYTAHPERHLSQEEVANIHRVPAVFTCHAYRLRPKKRARRAPASLPH